MYYLFSFHVVPYRIKIPFKESYKQSWKTSETTKVGYKPTNQLGIISLESIAWLKLALISEELSNEIITNSENSFFIRRGLVVNYSLIRKTYNRVTEIAWFNFTKTKYGVKMPH